MLITEKSCGVFEEKHMQHALKLATIAATKDEVPVGCVIVDRASDEMIASSHNLVEQQQNPLAHAEMLAIDAAHKITKQKWLYSCDIYVTLEPCAMCAGAISHSRLGRLYYGAADSKGGAVHSNIGFFQNKACLHQPEIYDCIRAKESAHILQEFFRNKR